MASQRGRTTCTPNPHGSPYPYRIIYRGTCTQQALGDGVTGDMIGLIICALVTLVIILVGPFFVSVPIPFRQLAIRYRSWVKLLTLSI